MSYGIGLCVRQEDLEKETLPVCFVPWMLSIQFKIEKVSEVVIKNLYREWFTEPNVNGVKRSILDTAPCDIIIVLCGDGTWYCHQHKPLDCSKGSGNEKWYDIDLYLKEYGNK